MFPKTVMTGPAMKKSDSMFMTMWPVPSWLKHEVTSVHLLLARDQRAVADFRSGQYAHTTT
mgnify:CR=1 FL=1